jgi:hypothetical protein
MKRCLLAAAAVLLSLGLAVPAQALTPGSPVPHAPVGNYHPAPPPAAPVPYKIVKHGQTFTGTITAAPTRTTMQPMATSTIYNLYDYTQGQNVCDQGILANSAKVLSSLTFNDGQKGHLTTSAGFWHKPAVGAGTTATNCYLYTDVCFLSQGFSTGTGKSITAGWYALSSYTNIPCAYSDPTHQAFPTKESNVVGDYIDRLCTWYNPAQAVRGDPYWEKVVRHERAPGFWNGQLVIFYYPDYYFSEGPVPNAC